MPLPNEHACRIVPPGDFTEGSFRRISSEDEGKPLGIIIGRPKGQTTTATQGYRYPADEWTAGQARAHCEKHDGTFEPADTPAEDDGGIGGGGGGGGGVPPVWPGTKPPPSSASGRPRRFTPGSPELEIRAAGGGTVIRGYAAVFYDGTPGTEYRLWDDLVERVMPTAFERALNGTDDVVAVFNHKAELLLGRQSAGTLQLHVDKRGLGYLIRPPDTTVARDVIENLRLRNITGSSFSFNPLPNGGERFLHDDTRHVGIRELHAVETFDVGPVTFEAYGATTAEAAGIRHRLRKYRARLTDVNERVRFLGNE